MHRLTKNRKEKKAAKAAAAEEPPAMPSLPFFGGGKKEKQPQPVEMPQLDLDSALPDTNDFRTSLIMPNLAQRFSILKMEQAAAAAAAINASNGEGGISSAIGSSVYRSPSQNFRQGLQLGDIAETSSVHGSIASSAYHDAPGRPSEDGSIMSRSRGGEGNTLFGGRQKVYRIPNKALRGTTSMEDLHSERPLRTGRAYYEHDIPESITKPKAVDDEHLSLTTDRHSEDHEAGSGYHNNRFTNSSTNSNPTNKSRLSTAATSVNSQQGLASPAVPLSPVSVAAKPRKAVYEQALDLQLQEQKSSAMGRLERLASLRRGAASPTDRSESPISLHRAISPSSPTSRSQPPWSSQRASPNTLVEQPEETTPPIGGFDFGIPVSHERSPSPEIQRSMSSAQQSFVSRRSEEDSVRPKTPRLSQHPSFRNYSPASSQGSSNYDNEEALAHQRSMEQIRAIEELEDELNSPILTGRFGPRIEIPGIDTNGISEPTSPISIASSVSALSINPATDNPQTLQNPAISPNSSKFMTETHTAEDDSPTLPSSTSGGLNLLVQQHMRSDSGASSIYAESSYTRHSRLETNDTVPPLPTNGFGNNKFNDYRTSHTSIGNPWEYDDEELAAHQLDMKVPDLPESPTSIYPPTIADSSHQLSSPPPVPKRSPERYNDSRPGSRTGSRPGSRMGGAGRSESRGGNYPSNSRPASRTGTRTSSEEDERGRRRRSTSGAAANEEDDWERRLAIRRQQIQQNIRQQEKVLSMHEAAEEAANNSRPSSPSGTRPLAALRSKASNGFMKSTTSLNSRPPRTADSSRSRPSSRPGSRNRQYAPPPFDPLEDEWSMRQAIRGPHPMPSMENIHPAERPPMVHPAQRQQQGMYPAHRNGPPGPYPPQQQRPRNPSAPPPGSGQRPRRPSVNTNTSNLPPPSAAVNGHSPGLPHPKHSPMYRPSVRRKRSADPINGGPSRENLAPGWGGPEGTDSPRSAVSATGRSFPSPSVVSPGTPSSNGSSRPKTARTQNSDSYFDSPTNPPSQPRPKTAAARPGPPSTASDPSSPPPASSRSRAESSSSSTPSRSSLFPASPPMEPSLPPVPPTSRTVATVQKVDVAEVKKHIAETNAQFQGARKRAVTKDQISKPTLINKTSSIPTINIPNGNTAMIPPVPPIPTEGEKTGTRARRKTQAAADLFNKLSGRSEEMEGRSRSDEEGTGEKEGRRKLRKSISDGEGLRGRGRVADMVARAEGMPKPVGTGVGNGMGALGPAARVGGGGGGGGVGGMI